MNVLHVIPGVAARYGGPSQAIYGMCLALQEQGIEATIATTDADGAGRLPVESGRTKNYQGVPTVFFKRQWSEAFKYSHALSLWLDDNVGKFDAVHIHAVFSHACLSAARACQKSGVPYIVRPLGTLDPWSMEQKPLRKRLMWRLAGERMLREAAAVHYTTHGEQQAAERSLKLARGVVIPLGIEAKELQDRSFPDLFRQKHSSLEDKPYVLALSRIHPKKNLELLIETFLSLASRPEFRDWRLVVAGDGEDEYIASLKRLVSEKDGQRSVVFPGWLKGREKISALQAASLFALTSYQENFGLSVIESLACGVPVLISDQVSLAQDVQSAGAGWVTTLDRENLSAVMAEALGAEDERANRGRAGLELVSSRYLWPAVAAELNQLYRSVVNGAERKRI